MDAERGRMGADDWRNGGRWVRLGSKWVRLEHEISIDCFELRAKNGFVWEICVAAGVGPRSAVRLGRFQLYHSHRRAGREMAGKWFEE